MLPTFDEGSVPLSTASERTAMLSLISPRTSFNASRQAVTTREIAAMRTEAGACS